MSWRAFAFSSFKIETTNALKIKETNIIYMSNDKIIINKASYSIMLFYRNPEFWSKLFEYEKITNRLGCEAGRYTFEFLGKGKSKKAIRGCMEDREFRSLNRGLQLLKSML